MTAPAVVLAPADLSGTYVIDPTHSRIGFVARHAMVTKVRGSFNAFEGGVVLDLADPARSSAHVTIEVASVDTRNAQRDEHLRTGDFFDAPAFPTITFTSTSVTPVSDGVARVAGDLTIKGVTRPVELLVESTGAAKDPYGNVRVGFEGSTTVDRTDHGVTFNAALETGGLLVSEKITIELEISAVRTG